MNYRAVFGLLIGIAIGGFIANNFIPGEEGAAEVARLEEPHEWIRTPTYACHGDPDESIYPEACWFLHYCPVHGHDEWQKANDQDVTGLIWDGQFPQMTDPETGKVFVRKSEWKADTTQKQPSH